MAARVTLSLREIAKFCGVSYALAAKWAREESQFPLPVITVNRAIGRAAQYEYGAVQAFLADRHAKVAA